MALTSAQADVLQVLATLSSVLSILGSLTIVHTISSKQKSSSLRRLSTTDLLVLIMSVLDIMSSLSFSFGVLPHSVSGPDGFACHLQAFSIELFALSTVFWNSCMAHNLYCWVVLKRDLDSLRGNVRRYLAFSLGIPLCLAAGLLVSGDYGFATLWCWIPSTPRSVEALRFTTFYAFVVLAWLVNLFVFVAVHRSMRSRRRGEDTDTLLEARGAVQRKMAQ